MTCSFLIASGRVASLFGSDATTFATSSIPKLPFRYFLRFSSTSTRAELKSPDPKRRNYIFFEIEISTESGGHGQGACPRAKISCRKSLILILFLGQNRVPDSKRRNSINPPESKRRNSTFPQKWRNRDLPLPLDLSGVRTFPPEWEIQTFENFSAALSYS